MEVIKQTNRTLLFEKFNEEVYDILTLIGDVENISSLDDEKIQEINKHLLVSDFNEFLEKFEPKIYSYMDVENKRIGYTLTKNENIPDSMYTTIYINNENTFIRMLSTLIENRKNLDQKNVDFKFEDILELISPRKIIENIKQQRKEINYLFAKYEALSDKSPKKLDVGDLLNYKFQEASKNYNNILAMLPLAIEDIKTRLEIGENKENVNIEEIKLGYLEFSDGGEIEFIEDQLELETVKLLPNNSQKLLEIFENDYYESIEKPNNYVANLIKRTYVPITTNNLKIDFEKEVNNYNQYLELYKNSQEDFIKIAKELIEKVMGVKLFFDQYSVNTKGMLPKLLITNVDNELLIQVKNREKIEKYLRTVNDKNEFENTIWFSIFPNISLKDDFKKSSKNIFSGNNDIKSKNVNTVQDLSNLMEILYKHKVQTFISFERNNENTFENLAIYGINKYVEKTQVLENSKFSEYIIPVLPNLTLIPKDKSGIKIDKKAIINEDGVFFNDGDNLEFFLDGIYIDAAYIAAGLVAAYQCPIYLKERFKNVSNNPGVRFNIEAEDNSLIVRTVMAREISGFTVGIKEEINSKNYGFIFASEQAQINNEKVKNITVYKARNLYKTSNNNYESIYKTLTTTYIERLLRFMSNDFKSDKLNYFFSNSPNSQKSIWLKESTTVNAILRQGDDISHVIDEQNNTCQLNLVFLGEVKNLKIEINKTN
ncbi:transcriptional regulator [Streptobacillus notomytis]|uniref:transcriptional regulator n=1 Tax=Streptobacillus notomytis TaxID=1712031 RepID=UPI0008366C28|nr:transcriptional regulator [Streptobacillus notomytis]